MKPIILAAIFSFIYLGCVVRGDQSIDKNLSKALEETGKNLAKSLTPFVATFYRSLVEANGKRDRVYFELSRTSSFTGKDTYVPYNSSYTSHPQATSTEDGYFTAPVTGTYFLTFHGLCDENGEGNCYVQMKRNGQQIATTYAPRNGWIDMSMFTVAHLNAGDRVGVWLLSGALYDDADNQDGHYTKFSGFLI